MKQDVRLVEAKRHAEEVATMLRPGCEQLEVAGSIRRGADHVGDIEIVAKPRITRQSDDGLWGMPVDVDMLELAIDNAVRLGVVRRPGGGRKYEQLEHASGLAVDLFTVREPAEWGVILLIRTGPARWSQAFVTEVRRRGMHIARGALHRGPGHEKVADCRCPNVPTPTEESVFTESGIAFVPPHYRSEFTMPGPLTSVDRLARV